MEIVVPSIGRAHDVRTIESLVGAGFSPLVVTWPAQAAAYLQALPARPGGARVVTCKVRGIALTRQWILENVPDDKIVMVDDDLSFHTRRKDDPTKFVPAKPSDISRLFGLFMKHLDKYAHVSMVGRQGGNRILEDQECARPWHVFGFNVPKVRAVGAKFHKGLLQDDFDMTLQLLRAGYPNRIISAYAVNQHHGHGAPGGAATYRTVDEHNASVRLLAKRHEPFVGVRVKEYARSDPLGTRLETTIAWKRAYASAGDPF